MKKLAVLFFVMLLVNGLSVQAVDERDAVAVDPTHHHVIMENDHVRVFEALVSPGATSPMHTHPPMVVISLDKARLRMTAPDGESSIFDLNPAQAFWVDGIEHAWELLAGRAHVIAVEIKAARSSEAPAAGELGPKDAVAVDPTHHHVILENDHVRVFEVLASPGATSPMHDHPPLVVVNLAKARSRFTAPDGSTEIFDLNPAQVFWFEDVEHSWELLSGQVHVFAVEVKAAR